MNAWEPYLDGLDSEQRAVLLDFMKRAMQFAPGADEVMSYGVPTLKLNGKYIIAAGAFKNHLGVYPFGSSAIKAHANLLKDYPTSKGTIRVPYDKPLPDDTISALVQSNLKR